MSTWLTNAANVAQVTGINAAATVRGAVSAWKAWRAHENTKDDRGKLKRDVDMLEDVQRRLQEQEHNPLATRLLPRLEETLEEARDLMKKSSLMDRFINGSRLAERFRDVETAVSIIYLSSFPLLSCGTEEFTLAEVMAATDFTVVLSASDSATVYRGTLRDGREVAVKRLNNTGAEPGRAAVQDAFFTEVAILSLIRHRHIARLVGTCAYGDERIVVTHPCTGNGSLYDHLHGRRTHTSRVTASWKARVQVLLGAARAVEHLHCHAVPHIIHANVTSSAILLEGATWAPRLSDFGRAVWLEAGVESQAVDLAAAAEGYADPEHRSTGRLKPASDVYSLGVVMLEVLTGKPPVERVWDEGSGAMVTMGMDLVSFALPSIQHQQAGGGRLLDVLDRRPAPDPTAGQLQPLQMLANTAARCLRQCGDDRPPIRDVVADLEKALSLICPGNKLGGDGPTTLIYCFSSESIDQTVGPGTEQRGKMVPPGQTSLLQMDGEQWVLDCRAMMHYTTNKRLLDGCDALLPSLRHDNDNLHILGRGSVRTERFEVQDVRYVDGDARNVISVAQLVRSHGLVTVFEPRGGYVRDPATGKELGRACLRNGAYVLEYLLIDGQPQPQALDAVDGSLSPGAGILEEIQGRFSELKLELVQRKSCFGMPPSDSAKDTEVVVDAFTKPSQHDGEQQRGTRMTEFYMDSSARHHMTWNASVLKEYPDTIQIKPPIEPITGLIPKSSLAVDGIGYIDSKGGLLHRVLRVPDSVVNLISISQLIDDYSVRVVFYNDMFWIEKLPSKDTVGYGHWDGAKYVVAQFHVGAVSDWVLDSSALQHHTPIRQMLYDFQEKSEDPSPAGVDELQIFGHGLVCTEWFKVPKVHYVKGGAGNNVISVAQLASDHGLVTVFQQQFCYVKHMKTEQIVGQGLLCNGKYVLYSLGISQDKVGGKGGGGGGGGQEVGDSSYEQQKEGASSGSSGAGGGGMSGGGGRSGGKKGENDGGGGDDDEDEEEEKEEEEEEEADEEREEEMEKDDMELDESTQPTVVFDRNPIPGDGGPSEQRTKVVVQLQYPARSGQYNRDHYFVHSCVTRHATPDNVMLHSYETIKDCMWNGEMIQCVLVAQVVSSLQVAGIGKIRNNSITLDDVLHIPDVSGNFVSVGKLTNQLQKQVRDRLLEDEEDLHRRANANADALNLQLYYWFVRDFAVPLQHMGVLWLLIDMLHTEVHASASHLPDIMGTLGALITAMSKPLTQPWIDNVRSKFVELYNMQQQLTNNLNQAHQIEGLQQGMLSPHRINTLIDELGRMGWLDYRRGTLYDFLLSAGMPSFLAGPLVCQLPDPNYLVDQFAQQLGNLGVSQLLINELKRQLLHVNFTSFIDDIAGQIHCEVPLGTGEFLVTVGKNVVVGSGAMAPDGFYYLKQLCPCPPVRLYSRSPSCKWELTKREVQ